MRSFPVPAVVLSLACCSLIAFACSQDTPQPLAVGSAAPGAQLMADVPGNIENDDQNYVGRIIVITDLTSFSAVYCGEAFQDRDAVIINPGEGPPIITVVGIDPDFPLQPGDRFEITAQTACGGRLDLTLDPITHGR